MSLFTTAVTHFSVMFSEYVCKQTQYFIDKAILGKICGVNVTYVADVDKGQ